MRPEDLLGTELGHYRIIRPLGYGGTSTVFLAQDISLQREVAVKVFVPGKGDTLDFLRRFEREARVLAQLDHPNILPVYEYGQQHDIAYLVIPYMSGGSLQDRLQARGSIPPLEAVHLISQMLYALQYAHDHGLIHRDIKPGNMLFKADGTLLLSDFGLVKVLRAEGNTLLLDGSVSTLEHTLAGTPLYMAPEQIHGQVTPASDIYAIGVVLYEMLAGGPLFTADTPMGVLVKHLHEEPQPLRQRNAQVSPALEAAVMRALEKDAARRYKSPLEFLEALTLAFSMEHPPSTQLERIPTSILAPFRPGRRRAAGMILLILALCLILASLGGIFYARPIVSALFGLTGPAATSTRPPQATAACPAAGTARPAVLQTMPLGDDQNIIYLANQGAPDQPVAASIRRHDVTAGGKDFVISQLSRAYISEAQVSQDSLWVLFTVNIDGRAELRMVRTDGQEMQTLYCTPPHGTIFGTQWSFDQKFAVFDVGPGKPTLYYLVVASGKLQPTLLPQATTGYVPRTWLNNTHVYLVGYALDAQSNPTGPARNIYILDVQKGANQHDKDLQLAVTTPQTCWNFDTNYDSTLLFLSTCTDTGTGSIKPNGPSTITSQPTAGGTETPLYKSFHAVTVIRTVTDTDILMLIENTDGDTSQNGLWKIQTDGSGLTQLTSDANNTQALCPFTQYAWSNTSVNHKMYALQAYDAQSKTYGMYYGLLSGGAPTQFADVNNGTRLALVGWISM